MELVMISAMTEKGVIGKEGDLPWRLPADWKHFKATTRGHLVLMGRLTFESLDGPLKDRETIILTSQTDYTAPGCLVVSSLDEGIATAAAKTDGPLMILGGATVYEQCLPMADRLILTIVHKDYDGDSYFPGIHPEEWELLSSTFRPADKDNEAPMTFLELQALRDSPRQVRPPGQGLEAFY